MIFYRCHRIGQTRDVHIYRLISEKTIEENILKKANQKRLLGDLAIEGGEFTTAFFKQVAMSCIKVLFAVRINISGSRRLNFVQKCTIRRRKTGKFFHGLRNLARRALGTNHQYEEWSVFISTDFSHPVIG